MMNLRGGATVISKNVDNCKSTKSGPARSYSPTSCVEGEEDDKDFTLTAAKPSTKHRTWAQSYLQQSYAQ